MRTVDEKQKTMVTSIRFMVASIAMAMLLGGTGCVKKKSDVDPFFEKWKTMAEKSQGYSPEMMEERVDIKQPATVQEVVAPKDKKEVVHPLPTVLTTLDVHDTEIRAVLQALAKAARQNILINTNVKGRVTVRFNKTPWCEAFNALLKSNALTYEWEGNILRVVSIDDIKKQLEIETLKAKNESQSIAIKKLAPFTTRVIKVKYANVKEIRDSLLAALSSRGNESGPSHKNSLSKTGESDRGDVFADIQSNSLILQARPEDMAMLTRLERILDRPPKQVHFKAYIVETTKDTGRELGIQWGGKYGGTFTGSNKGLYITGARGDDSGTTKPLFGTGASGNGYVANFPFAGISAPGMGIAGLGLNAMVGRLGGNILEAQLTALQTQGKANILSSPSITTMDNQVAFTESGAKVPYISYDNGDKTVKFEDAVLRLEIVPHVIDDTYLRMKILVKKDEVDFSDKSKVEGNPTILKKETSTNVIVRNNETIVISGLTKQTVTDSTSGVPGLADIPVLGWLFKGNTKSDKMEEILIFITPTVLDTPTESVLRSVPGKNPQPTDATVPKG